MCCGNTTSGFLEPILPIGPVNEPLPWIPNYIQPTPWPTATRVVVSTPRSPLEKVLEIVEGLDPAHRDRLICALATYYGFDAENS